MKKLAAIILSAVLFITLSACSGSGSKLDGTWENPNGHLGFEVPNTLEFKGKSFTLTFSHERSGAKRIVEGTYSLSDDGNKVEFKFSSVQEYENEDLIEERSSNDIRVFDFERTENTIIIKELGGFIRK